MAHPSGPRAGRSSREASPRSLVIAPQWIGDAVMCEPLLARLAARGERLTVAALPWVATVFRAMPSVGDVIELPFAHGRLDLRARWSLGRRLRGRFDVAYVLPNAIKAALLPWFAGIPRRVGYQGEGRALLLTERLPNPGGRPPMVPFYRALSGEAPAPQERPMLRLPGDVLEAACDLAEVMRGRFFVFAPGAEYGPAKVWPPAHYAELARTLFAAHRLPVLLLGSGKERALCEEIAALAPGACRVMAGRTSLHQAMALIAAARGVVTNDSGLMHVAAAFGVPQAAVFGSTSPEHTPPLNPRARVLWLGHDRPAELACIPCFERTCRYGHYGCLTGIAPAQVADALAHVLG